MKSLLVFLALVFGVQIAAARITFPEIQGWYASLQKPDWTPPAHVFGPVWTVLYILIAVSGWLVWRQREGKALRGLFLPYSIQLALNALWSLVFFGLHSLGGSWIVIMALLASILWTMAKFHTVRPTAAFILIPYGVWVSFAVLLNTAILWQNRS